MLSEISGENTDLIWLFCCLIHTCTLVLLLRVWIHVYFLFVTTKHLSIDIFNLHFVCKILNFIFISPIFLQFHPLFFIVSFLFFICLKLLIEYSDDCFYLILKQELFLAKMHQWLWYFILSIQYKTVLICFIYIFAGQHILLFCDAFNFNKLHNLVRTI